MWSTTKKALACMIDFMYALSTLTNQAEVLKNTQKSVLNSQLKDDVLAYLNDIGDVKDEILESMNKKAEGMRKRIVDILGETLGIMVESIELYKILY